MNKNTTILLSAIAVLAIGVGAYVSMSKPTNEGFTTQSFRKTVQSQPTTTVADGGSEDGENGGVAAKPIIKFNSDRTCSVTFDDGVTIQGTSDQARNGECCKAGGTCYLGIEPGVTGVEFGTQPAEKEKKVTPEFTTQSVKKTMKNVQTKTQVYGDINTENENNDIMGITVKINSDNSCSVTFDDGVTLNGTVTDGWGQTPCCGNIPGHRGLCYSGREPGVTGVEFGTQPAEKEKKVTPEFTTQSVKKTTQNIQPAIDGNTYTESDDVMGRTIKYNSDATCSVTFDDGVTRTGDTGSGGRGQTCCYIKSHDVCYNGKEPGVAGVEYGTQPVAEKVVAEENYY